MATDREDYLATTSHQRPSRILYYANFVQDLRQRLVQHLGTEQIHEHYGMMQQTYIQLRKPDHIPEIDYSSYHNLDELPKGTTINGYGVAVVPSGFYHFFGYVSPLRNATSLDQIENYPLHDYATFDDSLLPQQVAEARKAGHVVIGAVGHMYETAWQIRGYEAFLMDMIDRPAWAECMLDKLFEQNMVKATAFAKAGVDQLHCGDDVASQGALMFSKPMWERFMLSRWRKVWARARELHPDIRIWYHSDGDIAPIVPDLIRAGVNVLNPLQPECLDIDAIHREFGKVISLDGTMGTQSTMPFGTPDDVRARVKHVIDRYGRNGGLILSPTHILEPEVPIANIEAMVQACHDFGTFS